MGGLLLLLLPMIAFGQQPLVLGIHPYLKSEDLQQRFRPLADYLSEQLEVPVIVRIGTSYQHHIQAVGSDQIDIAFLGPSQYIYVTEHFGLKPLLVRMETNANPTFRGHIVVQADSPITRMEQLRGKLFAFGDPKSTMSSLVPQAMLKQSGIGLDGLAGYRHYSNHDNVALTVLAGDADAGGVKEEVYHKYQHQGLRSLMPSPYISDHVFVTRSTMSANEVERIAALLKDIRSEALVYQLLKPIKAGMTGLVSVDDSDFDSLRDLLKLLDESP
jgi:phosphonate transport system substrate-binding protein